MAADIDRDGQSRDMGRGKFDGGAQCGRLAAEALRAYIRRVYAAQKLLLHIAVNRDFVSLAYGAASAFLRDMRSIQNLRRSLCL